MTRPPGGPGGLFASAAPSLPEMRVFDEPEPVAERIEHDDHLDAVADVLDVLDLLRAGSQEVLEPGADVADAPVGVDTSFLSCRPGIRQEPELEAPDGEADIERLIEIGLDGQGLGVTVAALLDVAYMVNCGS